MWRHAGGIILTNWIFLGQEDGYQVKGQSHFAEQHCGVLQGLVLLPLFFFGARFSFLGEPA